MIRLIKCANFSCSQLNFISIVAVMESDDIDDSLAVEDMRSMYKGCMDEGK